MSYPNFNDAQRSTRFINLGLKILIAAVLGAAFVRTASGQTVPELGERVPLGSSILAPCSCDGNLCSLWPIPQSGTFPRGFTTSMTKITSFIEMGRNTSGQWYAESGVGGAAVTQQWEGGKCVKVDGGGGRTDEPAPAIFVMTKPGTYLLRIDKFEWSAVYDCRNPQCSYSNPNVLKSEQTTQYRFFTVEPEPGKCDSPSNRILKVTDAFSNPLDNAARARLGLESRLMAQGQTVIVPMDSQGISIYFEDGYVTTLLAGTNATFHLCPGGESADAPSEPSTKNISLETGTLESQTGNKASGDNLDQSEIMTPFSNIGHHGTTFTVEYGVKSQTTTVKVEQGSVWIRNRFGTPQTIVLTVGQTGEQKSNQAPKLIK